MRTIFVIFMLWLVPVIEASSFNKPGDCEKFIEAIISNDYKKVEELINSGADVNTKDKNNFAPIMWASISSNKEIVSMLLKAGADVNIKDNSGMTPLMLSVCFTASNIDVVEMLIRAGADVNCRNQYDRTALYFAIRNSNSEIITLLKNSGAEELLKIAPKQKKLIHCIDSGSVIEYCINKMQITFENQSNKSCSSVTFLLKIKDVNGNLYYNKTHFVDINLAPGEIGECKEISLSENVYMLNEINEKNANIEVEVFYAK